MTLRSSAINPYCRYKMVAKILIMLLAFAVYIIAAPHSTRQDVGGGKLAIRIELKLSFPYSMYTLANYAAIGVEEEPVEAEVLTPSAD
ncbi:hypothetical protein BDR07DRAFT_1407924, partial [Suillus spraguei]